MIDWKPTFKEWTITVHKKVKNSSIKKYNICLSIVMQVGVLGISLAIFSLAILQAKNFWLWSSFLSDINDNWEAKFIDDVYTTSNDKCENGDSLLFTRSWPGTDVGCACTNIFTGEYSTVNSGSCTKKEWKYGRCSTVSETDSKELSKFEKDTVCLKLKELSFINATRPVNDKCAGGMKVCGSGTDND